MDLSLDSLSTVANSGVSEWISEGFFDNLLPVFSFIVFITLYAVLIWNFYRFVSRRDFFRFNTTKFRYEGFVGKLKDAFWYFVEYAVVYPLLVFVFFVVFAVMLLFLSSGTRLDLVLVTSISLVSSIRISSYYNEDLARELSKLFPLVVLSVFLANPSVVVLNDSASRLLELPAFLRQTFQFILFVVALEWGLRFLRALVVFLRVLFAPLPPKVTDISVESVPSMTEAVAVKKK
ncbi:MAG: hypothetical protein J4215_04115 [Candidatus Diapherotrites archaeon]|uniref:Uncharacterized protein n=1 Tax=Candidatus Iainarchaeum sp. TaxID=3101447 RepID=A0A8T4LAJ5_9ARCH|nr:hypothetical protein [Candidatus Diapherotrites archaeon]